MTHASLPGDASGRLLAAQQPWLASAVVDAAVFQLRPDYRALLMTVDHLRGGGSDATSERVLAAAEDQARQWLNGRTLEDDPHLAAWRDAYQSFGAKPHRTRPSVEALLRRLRSGSLPRIDRITDCYNAVSIAHLLPIGGEDRAAYVGAARLVRANGAEPFDTVDHGLVTVEQPNPGEVVWCDDVGVTCRRWNWRQCARTRITAETTRAVFILDALDPLSTEGLLAAADALRNAVLALSPDAEIHQRIINRTNPSPKDGPQC